MKMAAFLITKASAFISANMLQKLPATRARADTPFLPFPWLPRQQTHLVCLFLLLFYSVQADCLQSSHFPENRYSSGISPGSLFRHPSSFFPGEGSALCPHRLEPAPATPRLQRASRVHLSLLLQLPTGAGGRPAASEEPARREQQVKGSENCINTGTRSH